MSLGRARAFVTAAACLVWLTGCESLPGLSSAGPLAGAAADGHAPGGSGSSFADEDPLNDLAVGKRHFRESNFGLAEMHFRRAVEKGPGPKDQEAEARLGLAASYDRLRRFDLADRAYAQAIALLGPTPEILNNQGYSYLLRGDYRRAHAALDAARAKDPGNPRIQNNLELLKRAEGRRG